MSDAKVREAAEQVADEALSAQDAGWWGERRAMGYRAAVECYLRGHADVSASLRELQQAAGEYRAASDELAAADAAYRLAGMSSDRGAYKDASSRLTNAEARLHVADAALAAQLPPPAEGAKGGG
jgi:hypothetical protein